MDFVNTLKNIPQSRLLVYILIAGLLPLLAVFFFQLSSFDHLSDVEMSLKNMQLSAMQKARKQSANQALSNTYRQPNPFYIDKVLESLPLLQNEAAALKKISDNPNFADNELVKRRLEFLTGPQNRLAFTEVAVQSNAQFKEVIEQLVHPVEVDVGDLVKILSMVEGIEFSDSKPPANRPQLMILDFKLDKKNGLDKNEVFQLNMKLLKREFT